MMEHSMKWLLVLVLLSPCYVSQCLAHMNPDSVAPGKGIILSDIPRKSDTKARYLFYLQRYIVETGSPRRTSPKFGVYEYEQILETFKQSGFFVISEARKKNSEIEPY